MNAHLAFDLLAYVSAAALIYYCRRLQNAAMAPVPPDLQLTYFMFATSGAMLGSILLGTGNLVLAEFDQVLGKSVLGGLIGGVVGVEWMKARYRLQGSTGALMVPGIALGIGIGRIGCYLGGLEDYTYGIATTLPWGVNWGDGIYRHPVQLYEALSMFALLPVFVLVWKRRPALVLKYGFYAFCFFYALQRCLWESLKPYPDVVLGLNLFQLASLGLIGYAVTMYRTASGAKHEPIIG